MGSVSRQMLIAVSCSDHNDEQDATDLALWEDLKSRVQQVADDPRYAGIDPMTFEQ